MFFIKYPQESKINDTDRFYIILIIIALISLAFSISLKYTQIQSNYKKDLYTVEEIDECTSIYHLNPNTKMDHYDIYKEPTGKLGLLIETRDMKEEEYPMDYKIFTTEGRIFIIKESKQ